MITDVFFNFMLPSEIIEKRTSRDIPMQKIVASFSSDTAFNDMFIHSYVCKRLTQ